MTLERGEGRARPRWGDAATMLGLLAFALFPVLPGPSVGGAGLVLIISCLRPLGADQRFSRLARALIGGLCLCASFSGHLRLWPANLLIPAIAAGGLALAAGFGRDLTATLKLGALGRVELGLILLIAVVAALALVCWVAFLQPDLTRPRAMVPSWPLLGLIGAGLGFSVFNALLEEFIWRGVVQSWLATLMSPAMAVLVQAASFGAAHYTGFPSGLIGVGLAAAWGAMIGGLALRSGGLLAATLAHIAADLSIFAILVGAVDG